MCHHSLLFGSDSPELFALRKLSHPPTTEASLKCVCVLSWMDVLSLLCEDEPKAMLTTVIVKGDWSLCTCVEVLVFGWFSAQVCLKLLSCVKPLSCLGCWCKHSLALFNIASNLTLFPQRCLFALRVWVNGEIAESVSLIYLFTAFLSDPLLFVLFLLFLFPLSTPPPSPDLHPVFAFKIHKFFICMVVFVTEASESIQQLYLNGRLSLSLRVSVSVSQLYHNDGVYYRHPACFFFLLFFFLLEPLRQLWLVSSCHGNRCCRAGHGVLPLSWKQVQLPCISTKQQQCQNLFCPSVCMQ